MRPVDLLAVVLRTARLVVAVAVLATSADVAGAQGVFGPQHARTELAPGERFRLSLAAGDAAAPVNDLFGLSFRLRYDARAFRFVDVAAGPFLKQDGAELLELDQYAGDTPGDAPYAVTRLRPSAGVDGFGEAVVVDFEVLEDAPAGPYTFDVADLVARTHEGAALPLAATSLAVSVVRGTPSRRSFVPAGDPPPLVFAALGVTLDFATLSTDAEVAIERVALAGDAGLPAGYTAAAGAYWTISVPAGVAFEAGLCLALNARPAGVEGAELRLLARSDAGAPWTPRPAAPHPADAPVEVCAAGLTQFSDFLPVYLDPPARLPAPVLVAPLDGVVVEPPFEMRWQAVPGAAGYVLQVAADAAFDGVLHEVNPVQPEATLADLPLSASYFWRVRGQGSGAEGAWSGVRRFERAAGTAVEDAAPARFVLSPAYPNPFHSATRFSLSAEGGQPVTVDVYDATGRRVARLFEGIVPGGERHDIRFEAGDLPGGVYFVRVRRLAHSAVRSVTLVK